MNNPSLLLYSETINLFLNRIRFEAKKILEKEMHLSFSRNRLFYNGIYYPLHFVVYEGTGLGYFSHENYEIGLHKNLMLFSKDEVTRNILRHELAHMFLFYSEGLQETPHPTRFRELCKSFSWDEEVFSARSDLSISNDKIEGDLKSERLLLKIQKLLALASSSNTHEAELATIKANEILLKHNLEKIENFQTPEAEICVKRVLKAKKNNARYHAIYEILKTFFVSPVFNYRKNLFYLEVTGERTNVELADFVANFLDRKLEEVFLDYQREHHELKGKMAKNSFMKGIAEGYVEKIKKAQKESASGTHLIKISHDLERKMKIVYSRLGSSKIHAKTDFTSKNLGKKAGESLSILRPLKKELSKIFFLK